MPDFQTLASLNNGVPTWSTTNTASPSNNDLLNTYDLDTIEVLPILPYEEGGCFETINETNIITDKEKLFIYLCEVLIRFDSDPRYYQKEDFEILLHTLVGSLIYLYDRDLEFLNDVSAAPFLGVATTSTDPFSIASTENHKYPGVFLAPLVGNYSYFNIEVTEEDINASVVILQPTITEGVFSSYTKVIYPINISGTFPGEYNYVKKVGDTMSGALIIEGSQGTVTIDPTSTTLLRIKNSSNETILTLDNSGNILANFAHSSTDPDKYLVSSNGVIKYRTKDEILSGINLTLSGTYTTNTTVGGLLSGTVLPEGTSLEQIILNMVIANSISNLTYTGYASIFKCDSSIINPVFSWTVGGSPTGLTLSDSLGQLSYQAVSGTGYASAQTYSLSEFGSIVWTLRGVGIASTTKTSTFVHESYYGKNSTGLLPTEEQILAETERLWLTNDYITFNPNTSGSEYGWVAVPQNQTGKTYTTWYVTALNNGNIGSGNFITKKGTIILHEDTYDIYMYAYPSALTSNLKLS